MELRTLGSVQLDAPARPEARAVGTQPKRLALLVYLSLAEPQGPKRRDALLALFWPQSDQDKGRQVLRQTVYLLRQSLGSDSIVSRSDEDLELDAGSVSCDARRFEALIAAGELRAALEVYRGDFLAGFFVPGVSQEFDEWVSATRNRLRGLASTAAWTLAAEDERKAQASNALHWARRATQLDPDNEAGMRDLMLLHRRLGDRIGALREYQAWVARLERDLGVAPGTELARLAASLRDDSGTSLPETADMTSHARFEPPVPAAHKPVPLPVRWPARRIAWTAAVIVVIAALGVAGFKMRGRATPLDALLAVGPIVDVVSQDSSAESLVAGDLLATSLARLSEVDVIPTMRLYDVQAQLRAAGESATFLSAARQAGASQMLSGSIHRISGGALRFDGQITALAQGTVVQAVRAEGKDVFELVDRTTEALAQRLGVPAPAVSIADVTTHSFVAYRLYQEGLRAFYASDVRTAQGLFRAAEAEDSTFAMAAYFDGMVSVALGQPAMDVLDRAARLALRAPDRERLLIRYRVAAQRQSAEAVPVAETLSARYPNDLDAMVAVAALKQRAGDWTGAAAMYRAAILQDSLSLHAPTARCIACDAYVDLWWTQIYADSAAAAERTVREWALRQGKGRRGSTMDLLSVALERQDRFAEALPLWRDVAPPASSMRRATIAIRQGDYAPARDTLRTLERVPGQSVETAWWTALALRNEGRPGAALVVPEVAGPMRATALFEAGRYREAAAMFEAALRDWRAGDPRVWPRRLPWQMVHLATALSVARDTNRLAALADSAQRIGAASFFGRDPPLHHYVRGLLWLARGDTTRAADAFRSSIWSWSDGYTRANYELAKALFTLGRALEAIYPLQAALRGDLQSANLYLTRTEVHALLARVFDAAGMADSAALYRGRAERAWAHAESDLPARRVIASLRPRKLR
jgi:DNA-binding SARP family transcriptional activator/tetratricopeptide (TPR) repeat protein